MKPAFTSSREATVFALLLAVVMALPAVLAKTAWLHRADVYSSIPLRYGAFAWIQQKIFTETGDVDIAFLGSSHMWADIDPVYVREKLGEHLRRPAEVFTLGWSWSGFDALYFVARDLLEHRSVRMLVVNDEFRRTDEPHAVSSRWFRVGEEGDALEGLPPASRLSLYGSAILGLPRHLLSLFRKNLPEIPEPSPSGDNSVNNRLGALRMRLNLGDAHDFAPYAPPPAATPADTVIYSPATADEFRFTGPATPSYQQHFLNRLVRLCQVHSTQLVVLHLPVVAEAKEALIVEREPWGDHLVGIPAAKLFAGVPENALRKIFYDPGHLNQNGQDLFTQLITPALLALHARTEPVR